jgi:hypothetical protein
MNGPGSKHHGRGEGLSIAIPHATPPEGQMPVDIIGLVLGYPLRFPSNQEFIGDAEVESAQMVLRDGDPFVERNPTRSNERISPSVLPMNI